MRTWERKVQNVVDTSKTLLRRDPSSCARSSADESIQGDARAASSDRLEGARKGRAPIRLFLDGLPQKAGPNPGRYLV